MLSRSLYVISATALMVMHIAAADDLSHPDKKVSSNKITGTLLTAQQGDYFHASVRNERGLEESFFVDDEICFLAQNKKNELTIEYDVISRFFSEGGGYYPANIIQTISTRGEQKRWVRNENAAPTLAQWRECSRDLLTLSKDRRGQ